MESGIYKIINLANGKFYIGSAANMPNRWRVHRCQLRKGKHHSPHLQRAWNKHGESKFEFVVVERLTKDKLLTVEQRYLDALKPYDGRLGYNVSETATGVGLPGEKNPNYGKSMSDEQKQKIREALIGHPVSESTRKKIGANTTKRTGASHHQYGKRVPEERRKAQSEKMKGRYAGIKNPMYGKKASEETRTKQSLAKLGKTGAQCPNSKKVLQYSMDGSLVHDFVSATEAANVLGIGKSGISACCRGKLKTAYGYVWRYADDVR